jgi:hypothetical protein
MKDEKTPSLFSALCASLSGCSVSIEHEEAQEDEIIRQMLKGSAQSSQPPPWGWERLAREALRQADKKGS